MEVMIYSLLTLLGVGFFACFLFLMWKRYDWVVCLQVFLLPIALLEPSPADLVFFFLALFALKEGRLHGGRVRGQFVAICFFYGYLLINGISLLYVGEFLHGVKYFSVTVYLIIYAFFVFLYVSEENSLKVVKAYVMGSTCSAVVGLLGYLGLFPSVLMYDAFRVQALFKDPNVFGPFLVPGILILLADWQRRRLFASRVSFVALLGVHLLGVLLSFSRGAWVSLVLTIFVYGVLHWKEINYRKFLLSCVIIVLVISSLWTFVLDEEFKEFLLARSQLQSYDLDRFAAQRSGLELMDDMVMGYGPGQYESTVSEQMGEKYSAHSLYVRVLLENGILGFMLLLAAIVCVIWGLFCRHLARDEGEFPQASVILAILVGILVSSVAVDTLHWRHFWLYIGLGLAVGAGRKRSEAEDRAER